MIIASANQVEHYIGSNQILKAVTFELHDGDRVGLIGLNGSGKSTLLRLLAGLDRADEGQLSLRKGIRVSYLAQIQAEAEGSSGTLYDRLAHGFREMRDIGAKLAEAERLMADPELAEDANRMNKLLSRYAEWQEAFEKGGGYEMDARIRQVASGLGIRADQFDSPYAGLSGGEKTKAGLAAVLIERPDLLLLDEPTNHLDLAGVEWLEGYLSSYPGTCLIVSHDRYFLDQVVTKIIELEDGESSLYLTTYSGYVKEKEERLLKEFAEYQEQQKQIRKMKESIRQLQEWGGLGGDKRFFTRAASIQKAIDRMEKRKRPVLDRKTAAFDLQMMERSGRKTLVLREVLKSYGSRSILNGVTAELEFGEKIALVGTNGSGKTTLFKLVLGEAAPDGGQLTLGAQVEAGYLAQEAVPSDRTESVLDYYRKEAELEEGVARGRLARYLFYGQDVFKSVASLSGGEWTRLRLALLVERKPNLLLLDEPTNHLDIASREALEETLEDYPGSLLLISHDRYLINKLAQKVWELRQGSLTVYHGNYENFREKSGSRSSAEAAGAESADSGSDCDKSRLIEAKRAAGSREEQAGLKRNERGPRSDLPGKASANNLVERIARLEVEIEQHEARAAMLEADLLSPQLQEDTKRLQRVWEEKEALNRQIQEYYEEWALMTEEGQ
ncbi:ribosomal protection-like ABC-F family protein [Gorillibacterium timonense]|uniref:ribosomal protection-like ABC-F family protein n=1 Tax=Gorillibacterium timonense TaxID=1689269 RepID=UPI00071CF267|nr:ABC-F family ATP-binding cassette domain-containing protein [Gorillibacterium timonense]